MQKVRLWLSALGLVISVIPANATPSAPAPAPRTAGIVPVADGCGWGFHRNGRGYCAPNGHAYYRPYPAPYWPGYYGDGHEPWNRPTPGDHVANQLNRQQRLHGGYWPY